MTSRYAEAIEEISKIYYPYQWEKNLDKIVQDYCAFPSEFYILVLSVLYRLKPEYIAPKMLEDTIDMIDTFVLENKNKLIEYLNHDIQGTYHQKYDQIIRIQITTTDGNETRLNPRDQFFTDFLTWIIMDNLEIYKESHMFGDNYTSKAYRCNDALIEIYELFQEYVLPSLI